MKLQGGISALLVEDNPADVRLLQEAVAEVPAARIRLLRAETLQAAFRLLSEEVFDVVLLDLWLPDESGLATLTSVHAHAPFIPIVVLTGLDDESLAVNAVRLGAQDYLVKGQVNGSLLVRAIRYATERHRTMGALERREEHFRSLIENALDLISVVEDDGKILFASPSHERIAGYAGGALIGRNLLDFMDPKDFARLKRVSRAGEQSRPLEFEFTPKIGPGLVLEAFARDLTSVPSVGGIVINARDVTERKRGEEALQQANETLRAIIQASPLAIYWLDLQGRIRNWNAAAARMLGWAEWELTGKPVPYILEEEQRAFWVRLQRAGAGETVSGLETRARRRDGHILDVSVWSALLRDGSGQVTGVVEMVADVTERKLLEQQLLHSQKMEAVGRLAGGVAHDFNNLLMVILGYSQGLMQRLTADDLDRSDLAEINKAAERAAMLTKQLLAFSRRQIVQPRVIDLNALVTDMDRMLRRVIGEDVQLQTDLTPDLDRVKADPGQLEQVLMNLAVNARDAMPGGGRLIVQTANVNLDETYTRKHVSSRVGRHVLLSVTDTGIGIDSETQTRLFEPFFTTKERGKGTGLGLSTSYGIVKQNGGDIWVTSKLGEGTTFKIYLPAVFEKADEPEEVHPEPPAGGSERVLLVEDEEAVRHVVASMLERHGYHVSSWSDANQALHQLVSEGDNIDLLITDSVMPQMTGRDLAEMARRIRPDLRVLYISGYTDSGIVHDGVLDSDAAFLQKPFTPEALATKVREVLHK